MQRRRDEMEYLHKVVVKQASGLYASLVAVETEPTFALKPPLPEIRRIRPEEVHEEAWSVEVATLLGITGGMDAPPSPFFLSPNQQFRRFAQEELADGVPAFLAMDDDEEERRRGGKGREDSSLAPASSPRGGLGTSAAAFNGRPVSMFAASGASKKITTSSSFARPKRPERLERPSVSLLETMAREKEEGEGGGGVIDFSRVSSSSVMGEEVLSSHVETTSGIMTTVTTMLSTSNVRDEGGRMMFLDNNSVVRSFFSFFSSFFILRSRFSCFDQFLCLSFPPHCSLSISSSGPFLPGTWSIARVHTSGRG
jgi:hypothetical protein